MLKHDLSYLESTDSSLRRRNLFSLRRLQKLANYFRAIEPQDLSGEYHYSKDDLSAIVKTSAIASGYKLAEDTELEGFYIKQNGLTSESTSRAFLFLDPTSNKEAKELKKDEAFEKAALDPTIKTLQFFEPVLIRKGGVEYWILKEQVYKKEESGELILESEKELVYDPAKKAPKAILGIRGQADARSRGPVICWYISQRIKGSAGVEESDILADIGGADFPVGARKLRAAQLQAVLDFVPESTEAEAHLNKAVDLLYGQYGDIIEKNLLKKKAPNLRKTPCGNKNSYVVTTNEDGSCDIEFRGPNIEEKPGIPNDPNKFPVNAVFRGEITKIEKKGRFYNVEIDSGSGRVALYEGLSGIGDTDMIRFGGRELKVGDHIESGEQLGCVKREEDGIIFSGKKPKFSLTVTRKGKLIRLEEELKALGYSERYIELKTTKAGEVYEDGKEAEKLYLGRGSKRAKKPSFNKKEPFLAALLLLASRMSLASAAHAGMGDLDEVGDDSAEVGDPSSALALGDGFVGGEVMGQGFGDLLAHQYEEGYGGDMEEDFSAELDDIEEDVGAQEGSAAEESSAKEDITVSDVAQKESILAGRELQGTGRYYPSELISSFDRPSNATILATSSTIIALDGIIVGGNLHPITDVSGNPLLDDSGNIAQFTDGVVFAKRSGNDLTLSSSPSLEPFVTITDYFSLPSGQRNNFGFTLNQEVQPGRYALPQPLSLNGANLATLGISQAFDESPTSVVPLSDNRGRMITQVKKDGFYSTVIINSNGVIEKYLNWSGIYTGIVKPANSSYLFISGIVTSSPSNTEFSTVNIGLLDPASGDVVNIRQISSFINSKILYRHDLVSTAILHNPSNNKLYCAYGYYYNQFAAFTTMGCVEISPIDGSVIGQSTGSIPPNVIEFPQENFILTTGQKFDATSLTLSQPITTDKVADFRPTFFVDGVTEAPQGVNYTAIYRNDGEDYNRLVVKDSSGTEAVIGGDIYTSNSQLNIDALNGTGLPVTLPQSENPFSWSELYDTYGAVRFGSQMVILPVTLFGEDALSVLNYMVQQLQPTVSAGYTPSPSPTKTPHSQTPSSTQTPTGSSSRTITLSGSSSRSSTRTGTQTKTPSSTGTITETATPTTSPTTSPSPTKTKSRSKSGSSSSTASASLSRRPAKKGGSHHEVEIAVPIGVALAIVMACYLIKRSRSATTTARNPLPAPAWHANRIEVVSEVSLDDGAKPMGDSDTRVSIIPDGARGHGAGDGQSRQLQGYRSSALRGGRGGASYLARGVRGARGVDAGSPSTADVGDVGIELVPTGSPSGPLDAASPAGATNDIFHGNALRRTRERQEFATVQTRGATGATRYV